MQSSDSSKSVEILSEIGHINVTHDPSDVNDALAKGYVLLSVAPGTDDEGFPTHHYVVGWRDNMGTPPLFGYEARMRIHDPE